MGHLDASMADTCLQNPLLDFSAPGVSAISNAFGTWMILFLALAITLWGFRGIRVFSIGFIWWGKSAQVRVMLQSSCSSFSASGNARLRRTDGGALLTDDLKMYRKMELPSCREQATSEKGSRRSEIMSKSKRMSSFVCDSSVLCDVRESDSLCSTSLFRCCGVADSMNKRSSSKSPFFSSLDLIFQGEKRRDSWFVFNHDNEEEQKGEKLRMLDPVGFCKWKGLESFESHYGLIKSGLARNKSRGGFELNGQCLIKDSNHSKVWRVNCERRPQKLLGITEDLVSCIGNVVRLWDVQVAQCLNETLVKDRLLMVNHFKDGYVNESLCSGIVTRRQDASLVVWDSRVFAKPVSYRLGNRPYFQSLHLIDNKFYFSDELNNAMFDLRMLAATPIEVRPVLCEF